VASEIRALIDEGAARLVRVADDPRREAELLLAAALGRSRAALLAGPEERILDCDATDRYESHVTRRAGGEPFAYILGEQEFWSLPLAVTHDVLVPRAETELVVERALAHLPPGSDGPVLDLATGSGAIALAARASRLPRARHRRLSRRRRPRHGQRTAPRARQRAVRPRRLVRRGRDGALRADRVQSTVRGRG
jgi:HemK-like putative methylase